MDCPIFGYLSGRSTTVHPKNSSSNAARYGQHKGIDPPGCDESKQFSHGLCCITGFRTRYKLLFCFSRLLSLIRSTGDERQDLLEPGTLTSISPKEHEVQQLEGARQPSAPAGISNTAIAVDLDYAAAVNSLTLLFLNDHEATRVAALTWLIMLHRKAPKKLLSFNDGTFPALLKTLSDPSDAVVTKDLQLLSQISRYGEEDYFANFMVNLLQLFSTDRKLLETRGNLIIRQLCISLSPERIYRTLADCIEREEDVEFASIMVQNLNNNLITAPQLGDVRKRLRNLEAKVRAH